MSPLDGPKPRVKFWELPLESLSAQEWELLCDHCGRCCLKKLEDKDTGEIAWTRVICRYHERESGRCGCYPERTVKVPECMDVRQMSLADARWMPATCAYRLRFEGKPLPQWHPLLTGSNTALQHAEIQVDERALSEEYVHPMGYHEHVIRWVDS